MKNRSGESVGFSFRAALWFWRPVILFMRSFLRSACYNSTFLLFLPSSVIILLAFLSCFLVLFSSGPNSFFSIKANQIECVFELSVLYVCLFHCVIVTELDYRIQYNRFRVSAVDSLNVKHELRSKKIKQFCIMQTFPNDISRFTT